MRALPLYPVIKYMGNTSLRKSFATIKTRSPNKNLKNTESRMRDINLRRKESSILRLAEVSTRIGITSANGPLG